VGVANVKQIEGKTMVKRSGQDVVYVGKYGETVMGVGPHRGKPLYRVPQDYIDWCLENLPFASMLRQVVDAEDIRRRIDGVEPKRVAARNKLAGDIEPQDVRQKRRSRRKKPPRAKCVQKKADHVPKGNHAEAIESMKRTMPAVEQTGEECPF
jgi:hypothetical protein